MSYRYYCAKCKAYIESDEPDLENHAVHWKNGITWYQATHKLFKVISIPVITEKNKCQP